VEFYAVGERIAIAADESAKTAGAFALPKRDSRLVARVKPCTKAKILAFRGASYETRWYFVEVLLRHPARGWIPASFASDEKDCFAE